MAYDNFGYYLENTTSSYNLVIQIKSFPLNYCIPDSIVATMFNTRY